LVTVLPTLVVAVGAGQREHQRVNGFVCGLPCWASSANPSTAGVTSSFFNW
jgi:hypothetical protein